MNIFDASDFDDSLVIKMLKKDGYIIIENVLPKDILNRLSDEINQIFEDERANPFDPQIKSPVEDDQNIRKYQNYDLVRVSE